MNHKIKLTLLPKTLLPKTLIAASLVSLFSTSAVYAHSSCDVDMKAGMTVDKSKLEFFESENKKNTLYTIDNKHNLTVRGKAISLNSSQQALVEQYASHIRTTIPQARKVAIEGVDLAIEGVNLAFNELLGEGNNASVDLTKELALIKDDLAEKFTIEHGFTIGENGLEDKELLGEDFEKRVETAVEKAVVNSMGMLMMALGQQMFSGGDTQDFETRMENFGENIEHEMELRSKKIEEKANSLCAAVVEIDQLEEKLKSSITPLADIDVITAKYTREHDKHEKQDKTLM
ncbi:YggN family protein [Colwellia sp. MSW7]|uniref:YggN family protein n=2 Tax=Colwellia maritima TaxID=2912588 RepID=A0ABS9X444_9GAMM|nr:DUF2884 family protein [Colwellia maritima]MCI2285013.1 YggN family protein [Colwellia maritima]